MLNINTNTNTIFYILDSTFIDKHCVNFDVPVFQSTAIFDFNSMLLVSTKVLNQSSV